MVFDVTFYVGLGLLRFPGTQANWHKASGGEVLSFPSAALTTLHAIDETMIIFSIALMNLGQEGFDILAVHGVSRNPYFVIDQRIPKNRTNIG